MRRTLLVGLLLLFGCDSGGLEFLGGDAVVVIEDSLAAEEITKSHDFTVSASGTVRVELTGLAASDATTGDAFADPDLTVGLGFPVADACAASRSSSLKAGDSFTVFLSPADYCISTTRPLLLPTTNVVDYTITVSPGLS